MDMETFTKEQFVYQRHQSSSDASDDAAQAVVSGRGAGRLRRFRLNLLFALNDKDPKDGTTTTEAFLLRDQAEVNILPTLSVVEGISKLISRAIFFFDLITFQDLKKLNSD